MLSIEMMCEKRLELGHQETIADVWQRFCTLRLEGANERSFENIVHALKHFISNLIIIGVYRRKYAYVLRLFKLT